ncbi:MAG: signal peptidase I [Chloroflexi bacterium]|nr:signal peptidase I [Chloroflexota bacterium]
MNEVGYRRAIHLVSRKSKAESKRRALPRILNSIATVITILALVGVIVFFMAPRLMGWQLIVVLSGSMEPTLPVGSVAFVQPCDASAVRTGDMLTFRLPEGVTTSMTGKNVQVTHRVVEILNKDGALAFHTKGDANKSPDQWTVATKDVVGIVRWDIPYLGTFADHLRSRIGLLLLVLVPGSLVIVGEVRSIIREVRKIKAKRRPSQEATP